MSLQISTNIPLLNIFSQIPMKSTPLAVSIALLALFKLSPVQGHSNTRPGICVPHQFNSLWQPMCDANDYPTLNSRWTISMNQAGEKISLQRFLPNLNPQTLSSENVFIPNYDSHSFVGWDRGQVASRKEKPLASKEFGPCIALLGRGIRQGEHVASFTSLNHVFLNPHSVTPTLQTLIEKVKVGTIELFITGGYEESKNRKNTIEAIIQKLGQENPGVRFIIRDDTFQIADSGEELYQPAGIKYVAFDTEANPHQMIGTSDSNMYE